MHGNGIRISSKHSLDVILLKSICKVRYREGTILKRNGERQTDEHHLLLTSRICNSTNLQYPRAVSGEGVACVDDVPVPGEAAEQIAHALDEGVELGLNQHLRD